MIVHEYHGNRYVTFGGNYYDNLKKATNLARKLRRAGFATHASRGNVMTSATFDQIAAISKGRVRRL